ncbi:MAG: Gfo/Idh/MocA family oxidoreductase [Bacteroidetes bacterium]|nr:MAG: Gfo/Idh/MocA family oxidoreductase [Bacteroidota bacterium]
MINWGILGCGNVTEMKSGPAFNKVKDSRLIAVMRRNIEQAEDYAFRHKVPKFYGNAADLINDKDINAVYVATPPGSHAEYAIASIKAGKPVYIEKPMALNYAACMKINKAAEKNNVPVFVAYYRRGLPGFLKVKDLIENGTIGKVRFVNVQLFKAPSADEKSGKLSWRVDPEVSGGGHFFDLASHQLDYLDFLFGPIEKVRSFALNQAGLYKAEDLVISDFVFGNNIAGSGTWCFNASTESNRDTIEITGDKGTLCFTTFSFEPIILINGAGRQEFINERPEHVQYYLIDKIVQALMGKGTSPSTGISAARTSRVMDEIVSEYYKGKSPRGADYL